MTRCIAWILLAVFGLPVSADPVHDLAAAIEARLLLMPNVARYKWNHDLTVTDPARESALLDHIGARAAALDVDPACARIVVEAQLAASRGWQQRLFDRWRTKGRRSFQGVPDLATTVRPAIDDATERLLVALRDVGCEADPAVAARLDTAPHSLADVADVWAIAVSPWIE